MQAEMNEALATRPAGRRRSRSGSRRWTPSSSAVRDDIAKQQLASHEESTRARLAVQQSEVDQARARAAAEAAAARRAARARRARRRAAASCPSKSASRSRPGTNLARVANPARLKAEVEDRRRRRPRTSRSARTRRSTRATASSTGTRDRASIRRCRTARCTVDVGARRRAAAGRGRPT